MPSEYYTDQDQINRVFTRKNLRATVTRLGHFRVLPPQLKLLRDQTICGQHQRGHHRQPDQYRQNQVAPHDAVSAGEESVLLKVWSVWARTMNEKVKKAWTSYRNIIDGDGADVVSQIGCLHRIHRCSRSRKDAWTSAPSIILLSSWIDITRRELSAHKVNRE